MITVQWQCALVELLVDSYNPSSMTCHIDRSVPEFWCAEKSKRHSKEQSSDPRVVEVVLQPSTSSTCDDALLHFSVVVNTP